jgi:hypothetical protein
MQLNQTFNAADLPQSQSYEILPDGWYTATITKAEVAATKDGTGQYIKLRYDITGPTHQGRVVFGNLNIRNQSVKAEEIGRQQLGEVMRSIGLATLSDSDQLIGGTLQIKVATRPADGKYEAQNEVKGFKSAGASAPVQAKPAAAAAPTASKAPWMK